MTVPKSTQVRPAASRRARRSPPALKVPGLRPEDEIGAYYDCTPFGMAVLDVDARYLRINRRLADLNGLPRAAHIGRKVREILPGLANVAETLIRRVVATGRPVLNYEVSGETPAQPGSRRFWLEHWYPVKDAAGTVAAIHVVVEEITERKRHEAALKRVHEVMEQKIRERTADLTAAVASLRREVEERSRAQAFLKLQRDLAMTLTFPGSLAETLERILDAACRIDGVDSGGIYLVDEEGRGVDLACHRGLTRAFTRATAHYSSTDRPMRWVMEGRTLCLSRADIKSAGLGHLSREGLQSIVVVPVRHAGRVVASLNLASHNEPAIDESALHAAESIAAQIGPAIARVRAEEALHRNERNLQVLFDSLGDFLFIADARGRLLHVNPTVVRRLGYAAADLRGKPVVRVHPPGQRKQAATIVRAMLAGRAHACDIPLMTRSGLLIPVETRVVRGEWNSRKAFFGISRDITDRKRAERELLDHQRQLRAVVSELAVAEENERRRIAHGLHDDISQMLATAKLTLGHAAALVTDRNAKALVAEASGHLDHVLRVSRSLTFDLASPVLQRFGLEAAVEDLCEKMTAQYGFPFQLRTDPAPKPLANEVEIVAFHAVRELLRNIVTHAKAGRVRVSLRRLGAQLQVTVADDGRGMGPVSNGGFSRQGGFGLYTIQERMKHIGGAFAVEPVKPHGTRVVLTVPLKVERAAR